MLLVDDQALFKEPNGRVVPAILEVLHALQGLGRWIVYGPEGMQAARKRVTSSYSSLPTFSASSLEMQSPVWARTSCSSSILDTIVHGLGPLPRDLVRWSQSRRPEGSPSSPRRMKEPLALRQRQALWFASGLLVLPAFALLVMLNSAFGSIVGDAWLPLVPSAAASVIEMALVLLCTSVAFRSQEQRRKEAEAAIRTPIELIFVRHGTSTNNEKLQGGIFAKLRYFFCNPCVADRDPLLSEEGLSSSLEAGPKLQAAIGGPVDIVLSSILMRAIETAYLSFVKGGSSSSVHVVPYVSEMPMWTLCYPRHANFPLARRVQEEALAARHGPELPVDYSLAGEETWHPPAPSMSRFLQWLWKTKAVQAHMADRSQHVGILRVAVVCHGKFMATHLRLRKHPKNNEAFRARLTISPVEVDAAGLRPPRKLGLTDIERVAFEQIAA